MATATVSHKPALDVAHCPQCSGQLANFAGARKDGQGRHLDQQGRPAELAPGQSPPRCYWIACSQCEAPVSADHPWQQDLDRQVAARIAEEADRAEKAKRTPPAATQTAGLAYGDSAVLSAAEFAALREEVKALRAQVAELRDEVAALKGRRKR